MSSSTSETVDVTMPQMGVSVAEGTLVEWKKQVGDWVEADEVICAISTDKIDTDVEAPATGRLGHPRRGRRDGRGRRRAGHDLDRRPPGAAARLGVVSTKGRARPRSAMAAAGEAGELQGDTADEDATEASAQSGARPRSAGGRRYSPVVMRMAAEHGLDLSQIEGTGRGGRVSKRDVLAFLESGGAAGRRAADAHRVPLQARRAGARRRSARRASPRAPSPSPAGPSPACGSRSAAPWSSRCRPRRRAPRSSRRT